MMLVMHRPFALANVTLLDVSQDHGDQLHIVHSQQGLALTFPMTMVSLSALTIAWPKSE